MIPKFRAWDKEKKMMDIVGGITFDDDEIWEISFTGDCWIDASNYILMQSTGLHDVNGKEIYEGDVVIARWWNIHGDHERVMLVEWNENELGWNLINKSSTNMNYEVIGYVHEHSHLLDDGGQ